MGGLWSFFTYIGLGISLAAPVGPINTEMMKRGIRDGFWSSWQVGLGGMSADVLWMLAILSGLKPLLSLSYVMPLLYLFGSLVLFYLGWDCLVQITRSNLSTANAGHHRSSQGKAFVAGFMIAFFNPLNIIFWVGIYSSVVGDKLLHEPMYVALTRSAAIIVGILFWNLVVALSTHYARHLLTQRVLNTVMAVAGICLIGFASYFLWEGVKAFESL
ncbi:LysE family transporter [Bacillaceae bacterium SIJ1]|uniref:LysE family translocator n=1 Tax=Litoribacterium kuwaitense TaxID=1398745 RepID=UPI0013ED8F7C|nr:LysE family transporter [Litoribacterium kuwaitense]NGP46487.1 LysE family transporter [Litoribacterium kuwaitense]